MTYTTQQLQAMSDFEVNKALANKLRVFWHAAPAATKNNAWEYAPHYAECKTESGEVAVHLPDYCNNPNDIMPLAFERYVGVKFIESYNIGWTAMTVGGHAVFTDKNPLRAIACLLLTMED